MVAALLAAVGLVQGGPIDYSCPPSRLEVVLKQLEELTSERLACSPSLQDEVVVVNVHQMATEELFRHIANVLRADWAERSGARVLDRTASRIQQNERTDEDTIRELVIGDYKASVPDAELPIPKQALDQFALELSLGDSLSAEHREEASVGWRRINPLLRHLGGLLSAVDWKAVRRNWYLGDCTFASAPGAYEFQLPSRAVDRALEGMRRDFAAIETACRERNVTLGANWETSDWVVGAELARASDTRVRLRTVLPYTSVAVMLESADGTKHAYAGTGGLAGRDYSGLGFDASKVKDGPYYSATTQQLAKFEFYGGGGRTPEFGNALMSQLRDPLGTDPHSFADFDFVAALSSHLDTDYVVALSDQDESASFRLEPQEGSLRTALPKFLARHELHVADGCLVARPLTLTGHEFAKLDRRALAQMLKDMRDVGRLDEKTFAAAVPPSSSFIRPMLAAYLFASANGFSGFDRYDLATLNFGMLYRSMTPSLRDRAVATGIRASALNAEALETFKHDTWTIVEEQAHHDPDNPRPYSGWPIARSAPPNDLFIRLIYEESPGYAMVLKDNQWDIPPTLEQMRFFGRDASEADLSELYRKLSEPYLGKPSRTMSDGTLSFEFTSQSFRNPVRMSFWSVVGGFQGATTPYRLPK